MSKEWIYPVGSNSDVDTGAAEDVWAGGGAYSWPASAGATTIVSGSAADAAGGTGARTVEVIGLAAGYVQQRETVTLNGTTAVTLTGTYLRILDCRVRTAGSGQVNAGALTIAVGGTTAGVVPAGAGRLNAALYTVPADRCAYIECGAVTAGQVTAGYLTGSLLMRPYGEGWQTIGILEVATAAYGRQEFEFSGLLYIPPKADLRVSVTSSASNMVAIASLDIQLGSNF